MIKALKNLGIIISRRITVTIQRSRTVRRRKILGKKYPKRILTKNWVL